MPANTPAQITDDLLTCIGDANSESGGVIIRAEDDDDGTLLLTDDNGETWRVTVTKVTS